MGQTENQLPLSARPLSLEDAQRDAEFDFAMGYSDECPHSYVPFGGDFVAFRGNDGIRWCRKWQKRCAIEIGDDELCELAKLRKGNRR